VGCIILISSASKDRQSDRTHDNFVMYHKLNRNVSLIKLFLTLNLFHTFQKVLPSLLCLIESQKLGFVKELKDNRHSIGGKSDETSNRKDKEDGFLLI